MKNYIKTFEELESTDDLDDVFGKGKEYLEKSEAEMLADSFGKNLEPEEFAEYVDDYYENPEKYKIDIYSKYYDAIVSAHDEIHPSTSEEFAKRLYWTKDKVKNSKIYQEYVKLFEEFELDDVFSTSDKYLVNNTLGKRLADEFGTGFSPEEFAEYVRDYYKNPKEYDIDTEGNYYSDIVDAYDEIEGLSNREVGTSEVYQEYVKSFEQLESTNNLDNVSYILNFNEWRINESGIPDRYKSKGYTKVGVKKLNRGSGSHKWSVLAKKKVGGETRYRIVKGGYKGMEDYTQHKDSKRRKAFWDRMGGKNSAKAMDPFSALYWHKRFGTW